MKNLFNILGGLGFLGACGYSTFMMIETWGSPIAVLFYMIIAAITFFASMVLIGGTIK